MSVWIVIAALAVGALGIKCLGPLSVGGRRPSPELMRVIALLTPAVLAAIVVVSTFGRGHHLAVDATTGGVAVGVIALLLRVPTPLALLLAAGGAAALHAVS